MWHRIVLLLLLLSIAGQSRAGTVDDAMLQSCLKTLNALGAALPEERLPLPLRVVSWNVMKFQRPGARAALAEFAKGADLVLLQESVAGNGPGEPVQRFFGPGYLRGDTQTGVLTAVSNAAVLTPSGLTASGLTTSGLTPDGLTPDGLTRAGPSPDGSKQDALIQDDVSPDGLNPNGLNARALNPGGPRTAELICHLQAREPWLRTPKAMTALRVATDAGWLLVINLHAVNFSIGTRAYREQLNALAAILAAHTGPALIGGDLNHWNRWRERILAAFAAAHDLTEIRLEPDWRSRHLGSPVDTLFLRGLAALSAAAMPTDLSDHHPIVALITHRASKPEAGDRQNMSDTPPTTSGADTGAATALPGTTP